MTKRCKPGDVVIVVRSTAGNVGRIGRVLRWAEAKKETLGYTRNGVRRVNAQSGWLVEGTFISTRGEASNPGVFYDNSLRPLRDSEGDDETLTWAGKPKQLETIE